MKRMLKYLMVIAGAHLKGLKQDVIPAARLKQGKETQKIEKTPFRRDDNAFSTIINYSVI